MENYQTKSNIELTAIGHLINGRKLKIKKCDCRKILKPLGFTRGRLNPGKTKVWDYYKNLENGWTCHIQKRPGGVFFHFDCH